MVSGNFNRHLRRTGLSVCTAMLLSSTAVAQEVALDEADVMYAVDPIFVVDPMPEFEDETLSSDETGDDDTAEDEYAEDEYPEDEYAEDETTDDVTDWDWVWDDGDGMIVIDDGLCIGVGCVPGDDSYTYDGGYTYDGDMVIYYMEGPRPEDCPECRDIPFEVYQMSDGGPLLIETETAPTRTSRRAQVASSTSSSAADCLALYPQLPWLCEWQNNTGQ